VPALRRALDQVVARHDALRVSFVEDDGSPVQVIAEPRPFALQETEASSESDGRALVRQEAARPFDLASGPLARGLLIRLAEEVRGGLQQLAGGDDVTLFMVLVAALSALLARCSGQDEIVVGTAVSGRTRPELEGVFGYLANTLVLRCDLSGDPTFSQLLGRM